VRSAMQNTASIASLMLTIKVYMTGISGDDLESSPNSD
jgi:hypothetical protein